jgi:DNA-directed RNA polymerase subunit RPC12/RpoP
VRTACACGTSIKVARQYVGRAVRCPHCGRGVVIPPQSDAFGAPLPPTATRHAPAAAQDGFIRFVCPCGKKLKMPAHYAGRSGKCPQCGAQLRIPPPLA